jgi:hypothetical protein
MVHSTGGWIKILDQNKDVVLVWRGLTEMEVKFLLLQIKLRYRKRMVEVKNK